MDNGSINAGLGVRREIETWISELFLLHSAEVSTERLDNRIKIIENKDQGGSTPKIILNHN